jgi:hypothetical protein
MTTFDRTIGDDVLPLDTHSTADIFELNVPSGATFMSVATKLKYSAAALQCSFDELVPLITSHLFPIWIMFERRQSTGGAGHVLRETSVILIATAMRPSDTSFANVLVKWRM